MTEEEILERPPEFGGRSSMRQEMELERYRRGGRQDDMGWDIHFRFAGVIREACNKLLQSVRVVVAMDDVE